MSLRHELPRDSLPALGESRRSFRCFGDSWSHWFKNFSPFLSANLSLSNLTLELWLSSASIAKNTLLLSTWRPFLLSCVSYCKIEREKVCRICRHEVRESLTVAAAVAAKQPLRLKVSCQVIAKT